MSGRVCLDVSHLTRRGAATAERLATRNPRPAPRALLVLIAAFLVVGMPPVLADDTTGEPPATPAGNSDQDIVSLLRKVEQQIVERHTVSPASDNAMETWQRVTERSIAASPETLLALSDFATRVRTRATNELAEGRPTVSLDFAVLADLATSLLGRNDIAAATPPDNSPTLASSPGSSQASMAPPPRPPAILPSANPSMAAGTDASPAHPPMPTDKTPLDVVFAPAPISVPHAPTAQELAVAAQFANRGDQMLAIKDISAARRLYEYAANAGNARAAAALARTFDPTFFRQPGVIGLRPDPVMAANWYRKAAALGDRDAEARLKTLGGGVPQ